MEAFEQADADGTDGVAEANLVDALKTRAEVRNELINLAGYDEDKETYRHVAFANYLAERNGEEDVALPGQERPQIAVVVARGQIVNGDRRAGMIWW